MRDRSLAGVVSIAALGGALVLGGCSWFAKHEVSASPATATSDRLNAGPGDIVPASQASGRPAGSLDAYRPVAELRDIHFDFDRYDVRAQDATILEQGAAWIRAHPKALVLIEGHADERGTSEYNVTLGDRRARSALNFLVTRGIAASRLHSISYGSERPECRDKTDQCWATNRRAHFLVKPE
jgi:peptidoglycan-associated lipoprotein